MGIIRFLPLRSRQTPLTTHLVDDVINHFAMLMLGAEKDDLRIFGNGERVARRPIK